MLFLGGGESDYIAPGHRERIKALFPAAHFARIPGAGHWLHAEKPREFEAAVRTWLDGRGSAVLVELFRHHVSHRERRDESRALRRSGSA